MTQQHRDALKRAVDAFAGLTLDHVALAKAVAERTRAEAQLRGRVTPPPTPDEEKHG